MKRWRVVLFVFFIVPILAGCGEHTAFSRGSIAVQSLASPELAHRNFGYEKMELTTEIISRENVGVSGGEKITFRLFTDTHEIGTAEYYTTQYTAENACKKLVIILPIYNSKHTYPQNALTRTFLYREERDTNVLLLHKPRRMVHYKTIAQAKTEKELEYEVRHATDIIKDNVIIVRKFIDWTETRKEICRNKIGIVGFSIGVPFASNVMSVDSRISAGALVIGGGELHTIFAFGNADEISKMREQILNRLQWTQEKLARFIKPFFDEVNPETYAGNINPERVLFINSVYDDYIPQEAIDRLWAALGRPERIQLPFGHKASFIFSMTPLGLDYVNLAIDSFFEKKL